MLLSAGRGFASPSRHVQGASLLFEVDREQLVVDVATLQVTGVLVEGAHGLALLASGRRPSARSPWRATAAGAWKIAALLDAEIP